MEIRTVNKNQAALFWENMAVTRSYVRHTSGIEKQTIIKALSLALEPTSALEIGCEGGRWSRLLSESGWRLKCIDINQEALNICQERIPKALCIQVNQADSQLPCGAESIGLILCIEVPEVINADWFIDEISRSLQKRGLIVGIFFNHLSWRGLVHHFIAFLKGKIPYVYQLSYSCWRKRLQSKGFSFLFEEGFGWSPFSKTSNSSLVPFVTRLEYFLALRRIVNLSPLIAFIAQKD